MNWIDYTKQKPTDKDALYLIEHGWTPKSSIIKTAYWNGRSFYNWGDVHIYEYKDQVMHWLKIEKPMDK